MSIWNVLLELNLSIIFRKGLFTKDVFLGRGGVKKFSVFMREEKTSNGGRGGGSDLSI
jgi:hypothetical protein